MSILAYLSEASYTYITYSRVYCRVSSMCNDKKRRVNSTRGIKFAKHIKYNNKKQSCWTGSADTYMHSWRVFKRKTSIHSSSSNLTQMFTGTQNRYSFSGQRSKLEAAVTSWKMFLAVTPYRSTVSANNINYITCYIPGCVTTSCSVYFSCPNCEIRHNEWHSQWYFWTII